ncbi:MAG: hypothetical protein K0S41_1464 [Anaerocolumna sp.]|jgi:PhnB protein|nr:hypothetical protein [Anaerocolumna sp.]
MTVIPTLHFYGQCEEAIDLYKEAFNCKVQYFMRYSDAVERGWEEDIPEIRNTVYHSEILFGEQLFRMSDGADVEPNTNTTVFFAVNFDTVNEVKKAFDALRASGTVIDELETTPYSACMGSVMDKYGIRWRVMTER